MTKEEIIKAVREFNLYEEIVKEVTEKKKFVACGYEILPKKNVAGCYIVVTAISILWHHLDKEIAEGTPEYCSKIVSRFLKQKVIDGEIV